MEVFVCSVETPSQFYIQVIGPTNAKLDPLVKDMTEYYESEENREMHALTNVGNSDNSCILLFLQLNVFTFNFHPYRLLWDKWWQPSFPLITNGTEVKS